MDDNLNSTFNQRLEALKLPKPWNVPEHLVPKGPRLVRVFGRRAVISGHNALDAEGNVCGPFGRVGDTVSLEQAQASCASAMRAILASLQHEIGDLRRVVAWMKIDGMVNGAPDFLDFPAVINPASEMIYELFGRKKLCEFEIVHGLIGANRKGFIEIGSGEFGIAANNARHAMVHNAQNTLGCAGAKVRINFNCFIEILEYRIQGK